MDQVILHIDPVDPKRTGFTLATADGIGCAMGEVYSQSVGIPWDRLLGIGFFHDISPRDLRAALSRFPALFSLAHRIESQYDHMLVFLSRGAIEHARYSAMELLRIGRAMGVEFVICSPVKLGRRRVDRHSRLPLTCRGAPKPA